MSRMDWAAWVAVGLVLLAGVVGASYYAGVRGFSVTLRLEPRPGVDEIHQFDFSNLTYDKTTFIEGPDCDYSISDRGLPPNYSAKWP